MLLKSPNVTEQQNDPDEPKKKKAKKNLEAEGGVSKVFANVGATKPEHKQWTYEQLFREHHGSKNFWPPSTDMCADDFQKWLEEKKRSVE